MKFTEFLSWAGLVMVTSLMAVALTLHALNLGSKSPAGNVWVVTNRTGERPLIVVLGTNVKVLCVNYPAIKEAK